MFAREKHLASVNPLFIRQASNEDPEDVFQPDEDMLEALKPGSGHWTFQYVFEGFIFNCH